MSGRSRLPGGEPRKASQRYTRSAGPPAAKMIIRTWRTGEPVQWRGRAGVFRRDVGDGEHAEIAIGGRIYRARVSELG
jgi:hypothetical protein